MAKIDWNLAQRDYISNPTMSYAKIAYKYGVSENAVKDWAQRDNWIVKRGTTSAKIAEKLPEKIAESISSFQARKFYHGKQVTDRAMEVLTDRNTKISARTAKEMLDTGFAIQTQAMGLDSKDAGRDASISMSVTDLISLMEKRKEERTVVLGEEVKHNA